MAVYLPIISEFNGKGIAKAKREFKSLEGVGAKTGYILKKAFVPATAALGALAAVGFQAVEAAMEDAKAQAELARVLRVTTKATDAQVKGTEDWITAQGKLFGFTDGDLRPALAQLVRVTKNVTKAQQIAALGMNVARGTGKDLGSVVEALAKAYAGNMKSLKALAPELNLLIKKGATADEVFKRLGVTFGGAASEYAKTLAGRMEILKLRFSEVFESIGYALIPVFEKAVPYFDKLATWLENNPDKIKNFAANVVQLAGTFKDLGSVVYDTMKGVTRIIEDVANGVIMAINLMISGLNYLPGVKIKQIPMMDIFNTHGTSQGGPTNPRTGMFNLPKGVQGPTISSMYQPLPSGVQGPTVYMPNLPLSTGVFGDIGRFTRSATNVTVNVNGGDPKAVVDAIVKWSRQNGPLPPQVRIAQ